MRGILDFFNQGWVGTAIGFLGLLSAFVLFWRSRIGAILAFQHDEVRLIGGGDAAFPDEVRVLFKEVEVPRLTLTRVWIWNGGQKGVRGEDIVTKDPLRIELSGAILKATVLRQTRNVIAGRIARQSEAVDEALFTFDFLDPGDGAMIELLHSGPRSGPRVKGTVRGLPEGARDWGRSWQAERGQRKGIGQSTGQAMYVTMFATGVLALAAGSGILDLLGGPVLAVILDEEGVPFKVMTLILGGFYTLFPGYLLWTRRRRYPRSLAVETMEFELASEEPHNQAAGADD